METLRWHGSPREGHVTLLDQTRLPAAEVQFEVRSMEEMIEAIRRLAVRGAPLLGVAGAYGLVLALQQARSDSALDFVGRAREAAACLAAARPTAVNLPAALERSLAWLERECGERTRPDELLALLFDAAQALHAHEEAACEAIGRHGAELLLGARAVLTHCNAGALCTVGIGTALAPIYTAVRRGQRLRVFADETRPLLQGSRLTACELAAAGIDVTVLPDSAAASLLARGDVQAVLVGADRIARNGDVANKVGTYPLAVLARRHGVPFHVLAPLTTLDPRCRTGAEIPIEERDGRELTEFQGQPLAPRGVRVFNPAFDVTPAELVSSLVSERGVVHAPDEARLAPWIAAR